MTAFVLDASVTAAWLLPDDSSAHTRRLYSLIRRDEVDIKNIPMARITEQYLQHVEVIRRVDINLAGEFLVLAATLLEIGILPRSYSAHHELLLCN